MASMPSFQDMIRDSKYEDRIYLISYDIHVNTDREQRRKDLDDWLATRNPIELSQSTYIVKTKDSQHEVGSSLSSILDHEDDKVVIVEISKVNDVIIVRPQQAQIDFDCLFL